MQCTYRASLRKERARFYQAQGVECNPYCARLQRGSALFFARPKALKRALLIGWATCSQHRQGVNSLVTGAVFIQFKRCRATTVIVLLVSTTGAYRRSELSRAAIEGSFHSSRRLDGKSPCYAYRKLVFFPARRTGTFPQQITNNRNKG